MMLELTKEERAYRRGALQAIQFLIADLRQLGLLEPRVAHAIACWQQELIAGRDSNELAYLGKYLDEIRRRVGG